ncbi:hypothetical protein [Paenibacillus kribbensis]|uniref:hypothetical protein n=1 Tax=Paenibacillus kribbensis TaxID=172713 RepID=UPI000838ACCF|nr:hypothetical protein [Paenibacillus kribbensis]
MTTKLEKNETKIAIIGLGIQGTAIAGMFLDLGYKVIGAVDPGEKLGRPLNDYVRHASAPDTKIFGTISELITNVGAPDVSVISASVSAEVVVDLAVELMKAKSQILTLNGYLFEPSGELFERLDRVAKEEGVSVLATGIQDMVYVYLPAVLMAANHNLSLFKIEDFADTAEFSFDSGLQDAGMALDATEFEKWRKEQLAGSPIQGAPLREVARRMGLTPGKMNFDIQPIFAKERLEWPGASMVLEPGMVIGSTAVMSFDTEEGVRFEGLLTFKIAEGNETSGHVYVAEGAHTIRVAITEIDQHVTTDTAVVRRVPDVLAAAPGFIRLAMLEPGRYIHPAV